MKLRHIPVFAALVAAHTVSAVSLSTPNMAFEISADATAARFVFPRNTAADKDFWRLILDDGARTEIPVFSHAQKGRATLEGGMLTVVYDRLVSAYGDTYDIGFTIRIEKSGSGYTMKRGDSYYGLDASKNALNMSEKDPTDNYRWTFKTIVVEKDGYTHTLQKTNSRHIRYCLKAAVFDIIHDNLFR